MHKVKEKFIVDGKGRKTGVILDMAEYKRIYEALEELDSIRTYDQIKASKDEIIPFEQAIREIENNRI
jgi:hypothetical protein